VLSIFKNFRGDVTGRSTQCGSERFLANDLGQAKISQLNVEILVREQNVLWFDIAVDNSSLMLSYVSKN
jgi:hypothetical protein